MSGSYDVVWYDVERVTSTLVRNMDLNYSPDGTNVLVQELRNLPHPQRWHWQRTSLKM